LIHPINLLLGDEIIGIELGVYQARTTVMLLQNCPSIKTLYGVDNWLPFDDKIKDSYNDEIEVSVSRPEAELNFHVAHNHVKYSGFADKCILLKEDTNKTAERFEQSFFDFIFLDAHLNKEQFSNDLEIWYPKLKKGGLFAGHDWNCDVVRDLTYNFRTKYNINEKLSIGDNTFMWIKK